MGYRMILGQAGRLRASAGGGYFCAAHKNRLITLPARLISGSCCGAAKRSTGGGALGLPQRRSTCMSKARPSETVAPAEAPAADKGFDATVSGLKAGMAEAAAGLSQTQA